MELQHTVTFTCATCGVINEIEFDPDGSKRVDQYEDCTVCCRSNLVHITIDEETGEARAVAEGDQ